MSIRIIADGADGYRLLSANNELLGWVRGRAIGVTGFADDAEAMVAARRAYVKLGTWLERQHLHPLSDLADGNRLVHDGAHRWLLAGNVPVARLMAGTPYDSRAATCAFEIVLKGAIGEGLMIHAALVVLRATHGSMSAADIAWAERRKPVGLSSGLTPTTHLELDGL